MVIFKRTQGLMGGIIFNGRDPVIPFSLQNREAGGVKVNTDLIKIITSLNKVREKVKALQKVIRIFTRNL